MALLAATGLAPDADAMCLSVHIPDFHGPLSPVRRRPVPGLWPADFFARHFPGSVTRPGSVTPGCWIRS